LANPEKIRVKNRRFRLRSKYGLSILQVDAMMVAQDHRCAICRTSFDVARPCVDHCHATGKIRAILCSPCNIGLGAFRDRPDLLDAAQLYLESFNKEQ